MLKFSPVMAGRELKASSYIPNHMGLWVGRWAIGVSEPSDIFDAIGMGAQELLEALDRKLAVLSACVSGKSGKRGGCGERKRFMEWLRGSSQLASVIAFHGGELLSDSCSCLSAKVVALDGNEASMCQLRQLNQRLNFDFTEVELLSWKDVCGQNPAGGSSMLRAYLSSELLMMFGRGSEVLQWSRCGAIAREEFDMHPLEDIATLVARDVKMDLVRDESAFDAMEQQGGKVVCRATVKLSDFARSAMRAMRMRRVPEDVRTIVRDKARGVLSRGI
jgi:hypothetical protein